MKRDEDILFNNPILNAEEVVALAYPANHTQNGWRAVGGKLFITNERFLFAPHKIDDNLGGESVEIELSDIESFFVKEREFKLKELLSGGLVERLGLCTKDGQEHLFVVESASSRKAEIEARFNEE